MELELRILKEKVIEDEKNSGIGSLFDDEKTSHQHIQLLKEKYMKMRKDFEKRSQDQARHKLDVHGEQFILDSQIKTMQNHQDELYNNREEYQTTFEQQKYETEKKAKETNGHRVQLEQDVGNNGVMTEKEEEESYRQTMILEKGRIFD